MECTNLWLASAYKQFEAETKAPRQLALPGLPEIGGFPGRRNHDTDPVLILPQNT